MGFFNSLPLDQVIESKGRLYLHTREKRSGALDLLERKLVLRSQVLIGNWLCNYSPKPTEKLDFNLTGLSIVHSQEIVGVLDLVVSINTQEPKCVVHDMKLRKFEP